MQKRWIQYLLIVFLGISGCSFSPSWNGKIVYNHVTLTIDETNLYEYVGSVDYVFVGQVVDAAYLIKDVDQKSTYQIHVVENLKGELVENIEVSKHGGLLKDGTMVLYESDFIQETGLPQVNETYLFMAFGQSDGSLLLSEFYGNVAYDETNYSEYKKYVENEIALDRKRFLSIYDCQNQTNK